MIALILLSKPVVTVIGILIPALSQLLQQRLILQQERNIITLLQPPRYLKQLQQEKDILFHTGVTTDHIQLQGGQALSLPAGYITDGPIMNIK